MAPPRLYTIAVAATLALAACSEREPGSTTGPQLAPGGKPDPCGFSNSLISNYFPTSLQGTIITLKQSMANAGQGTTNARTFGFEIMDSIGSLSRTATVDPSAGAALTMALIGCMFTETFTYPTNAASPFASALSNADGGAYYVRGGGSGGDDDPGRSKTVLGRTKSLLGVETNLSGIKPSSGSWTTMLQGNLAGDGRALIYGYPVTTNPLVFEWASVPSAITFSPEAEVSVCDDDLSATAMIDEEAVGVLAYVNSNICSETQSLTLIERGWGPKALAARVGRMFAKAFVPTPLQATAVITGTGGKTSTLPKSEFGKQSVATLLLEWIAQPPAVIKGTDDPLTTNPQTEFPVSFTVETEAGDPIAGTCAYLAGSNNNGTPTALTGTQDPNCTDFPNGDITALSVQLVPGTIEGEAVSIADFGQVGVTKVGGIIFTGTADVLDRDGFGSISSKSNVKPAGK